MNGNPMADSELNTSPVDQSEVVSFLVIDHYIMARAPSKYCWGCIVVGAPNRDLGLEEPGRVLIRIRLKLPIHEKERDETLSIGIGSNSPLQSNIRLSGVRYQRLNQSRLKR